MTLYRFPNHDFSTRTLASDTQNLLRASVMIEKVRLQVDSKCNTILAGRRFLTTTISQLIMLLTVGSVEKSCSLC